MSWCTHLFRLLTLPENAPSHVYLQDHRTRSICLLPFSRLSFCDSLSASNTTDIAFFMTKKMRRFSTTMQFSRGLFTFFQFPTLLTINFPQIFEWKTVFYGQTHFIIACIKSEVLVLHWVYQEKLHII